MPERSSTSTAPCGRSPGPSWRASPGSFRKRFQVPEEAVTIADRINQKCHHDWIEAFLGRHR